MCAASVGRTGIGCHAAWTRQFHLGGEFPAGCGRGDGGRRGGAVGGLVDCWISGWVRLRGGQWNDGVGLADDRVDSWRRSGAGMGEVRGCGERVQGGNIARYSRVDPVLTACGPMYLRYISGAPPVHLRYISPVLPCLPGSWGGSATCPGPARTETRERPRNHPEARGRRGRRPGSSRGCVRSSALQRTPTRHGVKLLPGRFASVTDARRPWCRVARRQRV